VAAVADDDNDATADEDGDEVVIACPVEEAPSPTSNLRHVFFS
jgi:hypothetical protein